MARVAGKVALVAGSGGGIGGAGAEALAREGAAVFCTDRDGAAAEATAARIRAAGWQAAASALDVCDRSAVGGGCRCGAPIRAARYRARIGRDQSPAQFPGS